MDNTFIFISWSGAKSREFALIIKELLVKSFNFMHEEIFVSNTDMSGKKTWIDTLRTKASQAAIEISCITPENVKSPWIHYEVGLCSYMKEDNSKDNETYEKLIIPILFNLTANDLDANLTMLSCHTMVCTDTIVDLHKHFRYLLYKLLYNVDSFFKNCSLPKEKIRRYKIYQFKNDRDSDISKVDGIDAAVEALVKAYNLYDIRDFFISRPMMGVDKDKRSKLDKIIEKFRNYKDNNGNVIRIFSASDENGNNKEDIPISRIAIIKSCHSFMLIYPKVQYTSNIPPSSCLIELGAALAYHKNITFLIEEGANPPEFINMLCKRYNLYIYDSNKSLSTQIENIIKKEN